MVDDDVTDNIPGELIETTPEHPFYVLGKWIDAEDLEVGMPLSTYEGTDLVHSGTVTSVERIEQTQTMYNLTVDTAHTFFVGEGEWLVHNTGCGPWTSPAGLVYDFGSRQGNRVLHVFEHLSGTPAPGKTIFNVGNSSELLPLIDEAWTNGVLDTTFRTAQGNEAYIANMGRIIGTQGESKIVVIVKKGTAEVVTSYPLK